MVENLVGAKSSEVTNENKAQPEGIFAKILKQDDMKDMAKKLMAQSSIKGQIDMDDETNIALFINPKTEESHSSLTESSITEDSPVVPPLNLPGSSQMKRRGTITKDTRTQNEQDLAKQANKEVTGPSQKEWNNFGVPKADDSTQLIDM